MNFMLNKPSGIPTENIALKSLFDFNNMTPYTEINVGQNSL